MISMGGPDGEIAMDYAGQAGMKVAAPGTIFVLICPISSQLPAIVVPCEKKNRPISGRQR